MTESWQRRWHWQQITPAALGDKRPRSGSWNRKGGPRSRSVVALYTVKWCRHEKQTLTCHLDPFKSARNLESWDCERGIWLGISLPAFLQRMGTCSVLHPLLCRAEPALDMQISLGRMGRERERGEEEARSICWNWGMGWIVGGQISSRLSAFADKMPKIVAIGRIIPFLGNTQHRQIVCTIFWLF